VRAMLPVFEEKAKVLMKNIDSKFDQKNYSLVDMKDEVMKFQFDVMGKTLLDYEFNAQTSNKVSQYQKDFEFVGTHSVHRYLCASFQYWKWIPTPANTEYLRAIKRMDEIVYHVVQHKHNKGPAIETDKDVLSFMVQSHKNKDPESVFDDTVIRDNITFLMLAGQDTTAATITFAIYFLAANMDIQQKCYDEITNVLENNRELNASDVSKLEYMGRVMKETLRLCPPSSIISRVALKDDVLGGYDIPAGAEIWISSYATHRHPYIWEDPETFDPDRFFA